MFGGIVESIGTISDLKIAAGCHHFTITPAMPFVDLMIGDSIAVNGVCLTTTAFDAQSFQVTAVPETLRLTNLHALQINDIVNLERALKAHMRIGGHYVQGHVDAMGQIISITSDGGDALLMQVSIPQPLAKYVVKKGYITLDGMSITVIDVTSSWFSITFIPHTQAATIVNRYRVGHLINIEVDIMGKYIEKLLEGYTHASDS